MREIKFRGYDGADWVYSESVFQDRGDKDIWWILDQNDDWLMCGKPDQYTGIKDENGIEIFHGSIVNIFGEQELDAGLSFSWNHNAVVRWDENECCFYLDVIKKYEASVCPDGYMTIDTFPLRKWSEEEWWIEYKVIGNAIENAELLEGASK